MKVIRPNRVQAGILVVLLLAAFSLGSVIEDVPHLTLNKSVSITGITSVIVNLLIAIIVGFYARYYITRSASEKDFVISEIRAVIDEVTKHDVGNSGEPSIGGVDASHDEVLAHLDQVGILIDNVKDIIDVSRFDEQRHLADVEEQFISYRKAASDDALFKGYSKHEQQMFIKQKSKLRKCLIQAVFEINR